MSTNSPGPWTVERRETGDSQQSDYYAIVDANGRVIMDTLNSEVQFIQEEADEHGAHRWDEQGRIDAELVCEMWTLFEILTTGKV